ncbi:hypothetical protein [Streptosporangium subroseum]|uniref:hypothetical protein n=1 Tax=Streptosporangium subroseum TaxID=106412 RepID=UPI00308E5080|nr:hypothetical protein OHB15_23220 [Streptosporangium subroseum]
MTSTLVKVSRGESRATRSPSCPGPTSSRRTCPARPAHPAVALVTGALTGALTGIGRATAPACARHRRHILVEP